VNLALRPKPFFKTGNETLSEAAETLEVLEAKGRTPSPSRNAAWSTRPIPTGRPVHVGCIFCNQPHRPSRLRPLISNHMAAVTRQIYCSPSHGKKEKQNA